MAKAHILTKVFGNNASVIVGVFSSRKKAEEVREYYTKPSEQDGWTRNAGPDIYTWDYNFKQRVWGVRMTPPSGNHLNSETFYIFSEEVM